AILGVTKISYEDFCQGREEQKNCPYYACKSRWQQELIMDQIADNIFSDPRPHDYMKARTKERSPKRAYKRQNNVTVSRYETFYEEMREAANM
ncbi:MAG: hypothetical protein LUD47_07485, partial [Clostridia bacterium]|nr:hypothetical protein [Clostridia bacterium]